MFRSFLMGALVVGGLAVAGCKDETKPQPPPTPSTPTTPSTPPVTPPQAGATTRPTAPDITVPSIPPVVVPSTLPSSGTTGGVSGTNDAGNTADATDAKAQPMLDEAKSDIKDKKWDEAQAVLDKLDAMKDKLSPDMQKQIANLKTAIDAGKNLKAPTLPNVPGTENK